MLLVHLNFSTCFDRIYLYPLSQQKYIEKELHLFFIFAIIARIKVIMDIISILGGGGYE